MKTRATIHVRGMVQGVGFRPYVYSLAVSQGLFGEVLNNGSGVVIHVEGEPGSIDEFVHQLRLDPPSLSYIDVVERNATEVGPARFEDFSIVHSTTNGQTASLPVTPDIAVCDDCVRELFDPRDRRFRYPFINCTNCGPRFTLIKGVPYDRERTTMRDFEMCAECRAEYEDPLNRRFHAEPIACGECGPRLRLTDRNGVDAGNEVIERALELLKQGEIVAIKGLGGYHLACDATNSEAVRTLRERKLREDKPFALMARSSEVVERYCDVSPAELELLNSRERPIVLLRSKADAQISGDVAPGVRTLGFMLPYTPLHYLLFDDLDKPLVMTSGNISDEPIAYRDDEAVKRLARIADYFLTSDRRIHIRTDDSIVRQGPTRSAMILRRSRGYAPTPVRVKERFAKNILACGAELKNTFCLTRDNYAFLSHHIGDLENLETLRSFTEGVEHFSRLFDIVPEALAYDLHPEYLSTKYSADRCDVETKIGVQHHHAHIASCMAENNADGEVIGVAMDGLGFGTDGNLWGGEFIVADYTDFERFAHLAYVPMPGGAAAIREPWRMAAVYLQRAFGSVDVGIGFSDRLDNDRWRTLSSMISAGTNCPETSSMGRLFDAVSALLCLRSTVNYEGQAAIALENVADVSVGEAYLFDVDPEGTISPEGVIRSAVEDLLDGVDASIVSARFHLGVADLIAEVATDIRDKRGLDRVALSGGVFQNMILLDAAISRLMKRGFDVLTHSRVPPNDGGISLGQAMIANARIKNGRV